jgi:hypothetical protein
MTEIKIRMNKDGAFPINQTLAGLVPMASDAEQAVLTADIKNNEQREPIVLWRGAVVDGRCRQLALMTLGKHILYRELNDKLTEQEVKIYVKSVNTRRNLTQTQKVMAACRESFQEGEKRKLFVIASSWGISEVILKNARYISKIKPEWAEALFDGKSIVITHNGEEKYTNKVSTIYAYLRKEVEKAVVDNEFGWSEDTAFTTQAGKEWYYDFVRHYNVSEIAVRMALVQLANYKYRTTKVAE